MKVREYARHRGVSHVAVLNAIKDGRLTRAITRDAKGKPIIDADLADSEWIAGRKETFKDQTVQKPHVEENSTNVNVASSFAKSRAVRENYQARLAQLEFEEASGKLVDADEVKAKWVQIATIVKTKVLGIPSKARQRMPELSLDGYLILETIVREALEELSDAGD